MKKKLPDVRWMSLWRHFFHREKTAEQLTSAMIEWQEKCRWDLLKINPAACYHALDWGATYQFFDDEFREPELLRPVVTRAEDVDLLKPPGLFEGALGDQLKVIRNLRKHFGPELPIVETIFSPIEISHRLMTGRQALLDLIRTSPDAVHRLLQKVHTVFLEFALECLRAGADGIFFATKWATTDLLSWSQYQEFGTRYAAPILQALQKENALVILHVCGENTHLKEMLSLPVDIFSYDFYAQGAMKPQDVIAQTGKFVLGGIDPELLKNDPAGVPRQVTTYRGLKNWLIGPSCVVPPGVSYDSLLQLKAELCPSS